MSSYLEGITLLQYADHTMFFIEGSVEEVGNLSILFDLLTNFSDLQINRAKLAFLRFDQSQVEETQCSEALATSIRWQPMSYFGLPLTWGRTTRTDLQPMVYKVERQLEGWQ